MIRRPPRSTQSRSSAASDVYKRQVPHRLVTGEAVMTYLRPPAFTRRVVNPLVARFQTGGVATLTVSGRRTGRARTVPVIPIEVDGIRYLVSPYGESQWVRN